MVMPLFLRSFVTLILLTRSVYAQDTSSGNQLSLTLSSSSNELISGECAVLRLSFSVRSKNKNQVQFYDLARQLGKLSASMKPETCLIAETRKTQISGEHHITGHDSITVYELIEMAVCPLDTGTLVIPELTLDLQNVETTLNKERTIVRCSSPGLTIKVRQLPTASDTHVKNDLPIVGEFMVLEGFLPSQVHRNQIFEYQLFLQGIGNATLMLPSVRENAMAEVQTLAEENSTLIKDDVLHWRKSLRYQVKATGQGKLLMSDLFEMPAYYDLKTGKFERFKPGSRTEIVNADSSSLKGEILFPSDSVLTHLVLIDISKSMDLEDLYPSRLEWVKKELKAAVKKGCSLEFIVFSGLSSPLLRKNALPIPLQSINTDLIGAPGTAIGDAIWFAMNYVDISKRKYSRKIILIGDGDSNSGSFTTSLIEKMAIRNHFKIFSIGVGTTGAANFRGNLVHDTFVEMDLVSLAGKTGGKYFRADYSTGIVKLIDAIVE
jgi:hypothetical protein